MERFSSTYAQGHTSANRASDVLLKAFTGEGYLLFDGGMGTMLQKSGAVPVSGNPDLICLSAPDVVTAIHRAYVEAGAQVITSNTFNSNSLSYDDPTMVSQVFEAAIACARSAGAPFVAADIGPLGEMLEPLGSLSFEQAYDLFAEQVVAAVDAGADLIIIETMSDLSEARAAVLAAKEHSSLPVVASMSFEQGGRTFLGVTPASAAATLSALGADVVGVNCSLGPEGMVSVVEEFARYAHCPIIAQPNAGLPRTEGGTTFYDTTAEEFVRAMAALVEAGATIVGGCCGTEPAYIAGVADMLSDTTPKPHSPTERYSAASAQQCITLPNTWPATSNVPHDLFIGEVMQTDDGASIHQALCEGDVDPLVSAVIDMQDDEADIIGISLEDVGANAPDLFREIIAELAGMVSTPLLLSADDPEALEAALRRYAGKPFVRLREGSDEERRILSVAKRYGCTVLVSSAESDDLHILDSADAK